MSGWARRLGSVALFAGAASAVLTGAGPDALMPFEGLATAAAAEATVSVAFVVDFGSSEPVVACVKVPGGTSGYQALADFTSQEQEQAPTYNASGLLCSINGDPASGCGQVVAGGYAYWSYWIGTSGTWQYASTGAFADVQTGDVEGWRFEAAGKANPSDPPPAAAPDFAAICGASAPAAAPSDPTTTAPPGTPGSVTPAGAAHSSSTSMPAAAGGHPASGSTSSGPTSPAVSSTTPPGPAAGAGPTTSTTGQGSSPPVQALRATADTRPGSGGNILPAAIGAGLVLALAGLAIWRWRRRPRAS